MAQRDQTALHKPEPLSVEEYRLARLRAEGDVVRSPEAFNLLAQLVAEGRVTRECGHLPAIVSLATAGLIEAVGEADIRLTPAGADLYHRVVGASSPRRGGE